MAIYAGSERVLERSEEHTSELQSQSNLVCRLLLEKKKKIQHIELRHSNQRLHPRLAPARRSARVLSTGSGSVPSMPCMRGSADLYLTYRVAAAPAAQ